MGAEALATMRPPETPDSSGFLWIRLGLGSFGTGVGKELLTAKTLRPALARQVNGRASLSPPAGQGPGVVVWAQQGDRGGDRGVLAEHVFREGGAESG